MTKEARMVRLQKQMLELLGDEELPVAIGALGLTIVSLMETGMFDHKLLTEYIDSQAEEIKRRMN